MFQGFYGGYMIGSPNLQNSVAGQEILPKPVVNFELCNDQECHISINDEDYIYYRANQGVRSTLNDFIIKSVKIQEDNKTFNWVGIGW
jgi:hypothetical protein